MAGTRRRYTPEFRAEAVRLVVETGRPVVHVAAEIGVSAQLLGRWVLRARPSAAESERKLDVDERAELERLRKERRPTPGQVVLEKSRGLLRLRSAPAEMFRLIAAEKADYTVTRMTGLLEVSRSGYYKWVAAQAAGPRPSVTRRAGLDVKVAAFHAASDHVYGSPRILADLRAEGVRVSRKTVAASMRRQFLQGISPRKFTPVTTVSDPARAALPDLVNREWDTGQLDQVWTSDITYLATGQGWLYLCAVRDGCSRRVIGWAMAEHLRTELVTAALAMAVAFRTARPATVVFHADRGTQYTSRKSPTTPPPTA